MSKGYGKDSFLSNQGIAPLIPALPWWQRNEIIIAFVKRKEIIIAFVIGTLALIGLIFAAHTYHWDWTGVNSSQTTTITTEVTQSPQKKVTTTETAQPGKTLWDWLQLLGVLAIPVVVGFGTAFFTRQQAKTSEANAENQLQEELLRTYFDKLSDLLLSKELSTNPNIQSIVRARTLAALHILNTERKTIVLRFLHDSDLLQYVKSFLYSLDLNNTDLNKIDLSGAELSYANLFEANLFEANLSGAALIGANLSSANLSSANLSSANLSYASLRRANLIEANLSSANLNGAVLIEAVLIKGVLNGANLNGAALSGALLSWADLSGANLSKATATSEQFTNATNVTPEQLAQIKSSKPEAP